VGIFNYEIQNNKMRKIFIITLCHLGILILSQSIRIQYELTYRYDPTQTSTRKINYTLDIHAHQSVFRTEMRRTSDSLLINTGYGLGYNTNAVYELYLSKDSDQELYNKVFVSPLSRDRFFIKISEKLNWNISSHTLIIGDYTCQKATVNYAGRNWTAWFAKDIPISEGPYYFHGLPGLIISIEDSDKNFNFRLTAIKKTDKNTLYRTDPGREISWEQYEKLLKDYFTDPLSSLKSSGKKVYTDNKSGGYQPIDNREFTKNIQSTLLKNNNPIELTHKIDFK